MELELELLPSFSKFEHRTFRSLLSEMLTMVNLLRENVKDYDLRFALKFLRYVTELDDTPLTFMEIHQTLELAPSIISNKQRKAYLKILGQVVNKSVGPFLTQILEFLPPLYQRRSRRLSHIWKTSLLSSLKSFLS